MKTKLTELKGEINSNTIIIEHFNTPFSTVDKPSRQKVSQETADLNNTIDQMDIIDPQNILPNNSRLLSSQMNMKHFLEPYVRP